MTLPNDPFPRSLIGVYVSLKPIDRALKAQSAVSRGDTSEGRSVRIDGTTDVTGGIGERASPPLLEPVSTTAVAAVRELLQPMSRWCFVLKITTKRMPSAGGH
jgi:hypothetical protein